MILFRYDAKQRALALPWIKKMIASEGPAAPRFTGFGFWPKDKKLLSPAAHAAGFTIRYEILEGKTTVALRALMKAKNPPENLRHLGLEIRRLSGKKYLDQIIQLQHRVFSKEKEHGNLSHSKFQLKLDRLEYKKMLDGKGGLIFGIFWKEKLEGFCAGYVYGKEGGITFCLSPRIQGLGVAKTGYRLILEIFRKKGVKTFRGGTSQPAVRFLSDIMQRKVTGIYCLKMTSSLKKKERLPASLFCPRKF